MMVNDRDNTRGQSSQNQENDNNRKQEQLNEEAGVSNSNIDRVIKRSTSESKIPSGGRPKP